MTSVDEKPGFTNPRYWEKAAESWMDIQDTFETDENGVIRRALMRYLTCDDITIDFGCGGGRYLPFLSKSCRFVLGLDISAALIALAQKDIVRRQRLRNVELRVADCGTNSVLATLAPTLPPCTAAICTNVLLSPEPQTRANILNLIADRLRPGGKLFVVVPAVSSALNVRAVHPRWLKERRKRGYKVDAEAEMQTIRVKKCKVG